MARRVRYVAGEWFDNPAARTLEVINPTTEEVVYSIGAATPEDVDAAVQSAHHTFTSASWRALTVEDRISLAQRLSALLVEHAPEIARTQAQHVGTVEKVARLLGGARDLIEMYVASIRHLDLEYIRPDSSGGNTWVIREPVGVVAGILPWNAPIRTDVKKVIPALLAGCTVVLKPSPESAFSAEILAELALEAGFPPGALNVVHGDGGTGAALVEHPLVRKIAFTGSTETGARIAAAAAPQFKHLQLELGGKSAAIVLPDYDPETTIAALTRGNWANTGQLCVALSRVLVPRNQVDEIVALFRERATQQVIGDPTDATTTMGPLVSKAQRDKVAEYIRIGIEEGAVPAVGGPADFERGWFVRPTVFTGVTNSMRIAREEIFGPVTSIIAYDTLDEAIEIANDTEYGLHGAVFSQDFAKALEVARRVQTGTLAINGFSTHSSAPFGGIKCSGVGREHGPEGYDSFLQYIAYNVTLPAVDELVARGVPVRPL